MHGMHIITVLSHGKPILQSDWRVEIPQRRPKDSAQVHQTLFPLEDGVWARDYDDTGWLSGKALT